MITKIIGSVKILKSNLRQINTQYFSNKNSTPTTNYPYVFGGLKNVAFQSQNIRVEKFIKLFGRDITDGFKEAYRSLVLALAEKDLEFIKNTCEHNLYKNIKFQNVEVVNPNAQISFVEGRSLLVAGLNFDRRNSSEFIDYRNKIKMEQNDGNKNKPNKQDFHSYISRDLQQGINELSFSEIRKIPITMGFELIFKSKMKLIPISGDQATKNSHSPIQRQKQELHSVQFEISFSFEKVSLWKLARMVISFMIAPQRYTSSQASDNFVRQSIGDDYQWKIGDIDRVLNMNLNVVQQ